MTSEPVEVVWKLEGPEDRDLVSRVSEIAHILREAVQASGRSLCVALVDDDEMAALNERWRGEAQTTDVLSFPVEEGPGPAHPLGDIVISLATSSRQADHHGWELIDELTFLLVHSVCHLMGHDHGEPGQAARMRAEEDRLLHLVAPEQRRPPTPY